MKTFNSYTFSCHDIFLDTSIKLCRNENTVAIAIDRTCFRNYYRATTLHSQNEMDKKLKQQFRASACLVGAPVGWIPTLTL